MKSKYIIDDVKFKVNKEEQKEFIKFIKEMKETLVSKNMLPDMFELFHDIDKEQDVLKLYMGFKSDENFDKWEEEVKTQFGIETTNKWQAKIRKYFIGYNYSEKIEL